MGGFTERIEFVEEKRLPTIDELNAIALRTRRYFYCIVYDRAILNAAALRAVGYTKSTARADWRRDCTRTISGNPTGLLLAKPKMPPFSMQRLLRDRSCHSNIS